VRIPLGRLKGEVLGGKVIEFLKASYNKKMSGNLVKKGECKSIHSRKCRKGKHQINRERRTQKSDMPGVGKGMQKEGIQGDL